MADADTMVQSVRDFVDRVDWNLVEEAAAVGEETVTFLRRHPWIVITAGAALTAAGLWEVFAPRKDEPRLSARRKTKRDALELVTP